MSKSGPAPFLIVLPGFLHHLIIGKPTDVTNIITVLNWGRFAMYELKIKLALKENFPYVEGDCELSELAFV